MRIKVQSKERIATFNGKSLIDTYPNLCTEWNYEKNSELIPEMFSHGSSTKVWWKCYLGHEWQATIANRTNRQCCPYCSNKKILQGYNDLATTNPKLVKEWNYEKNGNLTPQMVSKGNDKKVWWLGKCGHEWQATIVHRTKGIGCPICSGKKILQGYNDLATTRSDLAKEWNYDMNGTLTPQMVTKGSQKKVWWKGKCKHEWQAIIACRVKGAGCPYCSNKKIILGFNDILTTHPELAKEWNYEKNETITPQQCTLHSGKKVWWKCEKGHEWMATIANRTKGTNCPYCVKESKKETL